MKKRVIKVAVVGKNIMADPMASEATLYFISEHQNINKQAHFYSVF